MAVIGRPILTEHGEIKAGIRHGTVRGYRNHKCRCLECRRAHREAQRQHNEMKRQELNAMKARLAELEAVVAAK